MAAQLSLLATPNYEGGVVNDRGTGALLCSSSLTSGANPQPNSSYSNSKSWCFLVQSWNGIWSLKQIHLFP